MCRGRLDAVLRGIVSASANGYMFSWNNWGTWMRDWYPLRAMKSNWGGVDHAIPELVLKSA